MKPKLYFYITFAFILLGSIFPCKADIIARDVEIEYFLEELAKPLILQDSYKKQTETYPSLASSNEPHAGLYDSTWWGVRGGKAVPVYQIPTPSEPLTTPGKFAGAYISELDKKPKIKINFYLIPSNNVNAFVANGKNMYINSSLITIYDNTNLLRGVMAHELGHIFNAHLTRHQIDMMQAQQSGLIASSIVGILSLGGGAFPALLAGAGAGAATARGDALSFSRTYEKEADATGLGYLERSAFTAHGLLDLMEYFQQKQGEVSQLASYFQTHPLPSERLEVIKRFANSEDKMYIKTDLAMEDKFQRVKAKITGYFGKSNLKINTIHSGAPSAISKNQDFYQKYEDMFAAFSKSNYSEVINIGESLIVKKPNDAYIAEVLGQSYCMIKNVENAIKYFTIVRNSIRNNPVIEYEYGDCLIKNAVQENPQYLNEGVRVLRMIPLNPETVQSRILLVDAAQKYNNQGLYVLSQAEIYLTQDKKDQAKNLIAEAMKKDNFYSLDYYPEIQELYNHLSLS